MIPDWVTSRFQRMSVAATELSPRYPFLMRREVTALKRVVRLVRQANARIPKITRAPSKMAMLKDSLVDRALSGVACPPPVPAVKC